MRKARSPSMSNVRYWLRRMTEWLRQALLSSRGALRVRSHALSPVLKLVAVSAPLGVALMIFGPHAWIRVMGALLSTVPLVLFCVAYLYLLFRDPDRLGADTLITRQQLLKLAEKTKDTKLIAVLGKALPLVPDPEPPQKPELQPGANEEEP